MEPMRVMVRERQRGKSSEALRWVSQGERVGTYPGWTRVLIVATVHLEVNMRGWKDPDGVAWWDRIEDWSHRVYDQMTWVDRYRRTSFGPAVLVDDLTLCLVHGGDEMAQIFAYDNVVGCTVNGQIWDPPLLPGWE